MKKYLCMLLVLSLILSAMLMMVSCTEEPSVTQTPKSTTQAVTTAKPTATIAPEPTVEKPEQLTVWTAQLATVEDLETNRFTEYYEELTGIHINWILANHSDMTEKFNISIGSGDYADIYLGPMINSATVLSCAEAGYYSVEQFD